MASKNIILILLLIFVVGAGALWYSVRDKEDGVLEEYDGTKQEEQEPIATDNSEDLPNEAGQLDKAGDARVLATIAQMRTVAVLTDVNDGNYDNFNCEDTDMIFLCDEISSIDREVEIVVFPEKNSIESCVYSRMFANTKQWYCADSKGNAGFTDEFPGSPEFCKDGSSAKCPTLSY